MTSQTASPGVPKRRKLTACEKAGTCNHEGEETVRQACAAATDPDTGGCQGDGYVNVPVSYAGETWVCEADL